METTLSHLKISRASDSITQILRDCIANGVFRPGQRLDVKELARKLDVSPTPIKDALNRLAAEGLIDIRPRRGTFVTRVSAEDVMETFEIRAALECLAAEKAVQRLTPEVMGRFRSLVADLEKPVANEQERLFHEQKNLEFHNLIVELSGSRKLKKMYASLKIHIQIMTVHFFGPEGGVLRMENEEKAEHREILSALEARDAARLVRALRQHVLRASQCLAEDLRQKNLAAD